MILVGGSSLMRLVTEMAGELFPAATPQRSQVFTAVVDGLALCGGERRDGPARDGVGVVWAATPVRKL